MPRIDKPDDAMRRVRDDGSVVEARTRVRDDGVTSEVCVTAPDGATERWVFEDSFTDDATDRVRHERAAPNGAVLATEEGFSPALFLAKRGELFADNSAGVDFGPLRLTYSTAYSSAVLYSEGRAPDGSARSVVASLGVHAAFPFPQEHWDEGQIAILDANHDKLMSLRMPRASEEAHLDLSIEDEVGDSGDARKRLVYRGYMQDDDGALRFVEASYVLSQKDVEKKEPGLWDRVTARINATVGFEQNARLLGELAVPASSLVIDGEPVLDIERTVGSLDDGARFNNLPNSALTAINYAPEAAPLVALIDPAENEARYRFDATLLRDDGALLHRLLPRALRRGTLAAHYVVDGDGKRHDVDDKLVADGPPLSTKHYTWELDGEQVATMTRELVRYRDAAGRVELGFRETIRRVKG
jgi:hypothetical protein